MKFKVLGSGQDAGIPHIDCACSVCSWARRHKAYQRLGPSLAIFNRQSCYLIDISPDFKYQLRMVRDEIAKPRRKGLPVDGILLTHAHLGHCAGLWYLGKEARETRDLPVFCTPKMKRFLYKNYPFSLLVQRRNIQVKAIYPDKEFRLKGFKCIPFLVPHRNEIADTVGYIIKAEKRVVYLPDIDRWTDRVIKVIKDADIALIDGSFYSQGELPRFKEVPHPPIQQTTKLLAKLDTQVYFTHINHTNPINKKGRERKYIRDKGFKIAYDGMILKI